MYRKNSMNEFPLKLSIILQIRSPAWMAEQNVDITWRLPSQLLLPLKLCYKRNSLLPLAATVFCSSCLTKIAFLAILTQTFAYTPKCSSTVSHRRWNMYKSCCSTGGLCYCQNYLLIQQWSKSIFCIKIPWLFFWVFVKRDIMNNTGNCEYCFLH